MEASRAVQEESGVELGPRTSLNRREWVLLMAAAAALQLIAWLVVLELLSTVLKWGYDPRNVSPDVVHYADVATRVLIGRQWPYSAFPFEYPPLSILLFVLPPVKDTLASYHGWFAAQMIAIGMITAAVTAAAAARIWNGLARPLTAAAALALGVVMMGAIALEVFDGAVALVLALAVLCLVYRRWTLAALTIGLGFSVKLMPIVMLPLALILARTRRRVLWALLAGVAAAAAPFVPFLVHDEGGDRRSSAQIGRSEGVPVAAQCLAGGGLRRHRWRSVEIAVA